jgi:CheY-like chemotaxis protein
MSRRILLADDSVTIQKVIELTFMDEDFEVSAVSNGDEAVQLLPGLLPDFVIADVHMPGANGYEVCRRSKALYPHVPVLLLVGTFEPFDESQSRAAGADAFLKKPFDSQELLHTVQKLLAQGGEGGAPAPAASPAPAPAAEAAPAMPPMPAFPDLGELGALPEAEAPWANFELEAEPEPAAPAASAASAASGYAWSSPSFTPEVASPADEPLFELEPDVEALSLSEEPFSFAADGLGATEFAEVPAPPAFPAGLRTSATPTPEESVGVPFGASPLASGLGEVEHRITEHAVGHEALPDLPDWAATPPSPTAISAPATPSTPSTPSNTARSAGLAVGSVALHSDRLSDEDIDRIARRLVEILGDKVVRDIAWEVVPDLAEVVIKDRLRELESQVE